MQNETIASSAWHQRWPAPAKINRFLHIIGRRKDGYHLLQSIFQFVDYSDYLIFSPEKSARIKLENSIDSVADEDNLIIKAAKLLQQTTSTLQGVSIQLEKNIPMGAGLGGGSSDAATTLLVLNKLWQCGLSIDELTDLGIQLGADVPFFIHGKTAFVEGIGERITAIEIDRPWLLLAIPPCHIATAEVFAVAELPRNTQAIKYSALTNKSPSELARFGHNDCQQTVSNNYSELKTALNWLTLASSPRLTGTGSCVFSMFDKRENAEKFAATRPNNIETIVTKALQTSPLHSLLDN